MNKQTAVEWLRHQLIENMVCKDPAKGISIMYFHDNAFLDLCRKAKQMEKEQIAKAFEEGDDWSQNYFDNLMPVGEVYYKQTYGGDHD
jgi:hypothetical protein